MKKLLVVLLMFALVLPAAAQELSKKEKKAQGYAAMKAMVQAGTWEFQAVDAQTQKGRRISLISNPNFLKIADGKAHAEMPYFGVVQGASGYGEDAGIKFDPTEMEDVEIKYNDKKQKIIVTFKVKSDEIYDFSVTIFWSQKATMSVNSLSRNRITYQGAAGTSAE